MGYDPFRPKSAQNRWALKGRAGCIAGTRGLYQPAYPLTDATRNIISADAINKMKKGVRIVNCARGGLVDELALLAALNAGHAAGAALDVFETEPARDNPLFEAENFIATRIWGQVPLTQEKVALQWPNKWCYLTTGAVTNAINIPPVTARKLNSETLYEFGRIVGRFLGQTDLPELNAVKLV